MIVKRKENMDDDPVVFFRDFYLYSVSFFFFFLSFFFRPCLHELPTVEVKCQPFTAWVAHYYFKNNDEIGIRTGGKRHYSSQLFHKTSIEKGRPQIPAVSLVFDSGA